MIMNKLTHYIRILFVLLLAFIQSSCYLAEGGISGSGKENGIALAPISGTGKLVATGITFDTDNAVISFNGESGNSDQLKVGMVVNVAGQIDTAQGIGEAESIDFDFSLIGQITKNDKVNSILEALGKNIIIDSQTIFEATNFDSLNNGDFIAVSGLITSEGGIQATYIEKRQFLPSSLVVEGVVSNLEENNKTFNIKNIQKSRRTEPLSFDYSSAILTNFTNDTLFEDDLVRIEGHFDANNNGIKSGTFIVTHIKNKQAGFRTLNGGLFLLDGLVRGKPSSNSLEINGVTFVTDSNTQFVNVADISAINLNDRLQIEARANDAGEFTADLVIFVKSPSTTIQATVDAVESNGSITLLGRPVTTNGFTVFLDSSSTNINKFSIADLATGDVVQIGVSVSNSGMLVATQLTRLDSADDNTVSIEGPADPIIASPLLSIAGLSIDTAALQDNIGFNLGSASTLDRSQFFSVLKTGMKIKVNGSFVTPALIASDITIVNCCNFSMLDSNGAVVGGANDVVFSWDGSLYTDPVSQTTPNMTLAVNQQLFNSRPWTVHDARVFGPGDYSFNASPGKTLELSIGPGQVGAHLLFDWGVESEVTPCLVRYCDIDIVLLWDRDGVVTTGFGVDGQTFDLVSVDGNGDGIPGIPMVEGPFEGLQPNFNLLIIPQ